MGNTSQQHLHSSYSQQDLHLTSNRNHINHQRDQFCFAEMKIGKASKQSGSIRLSLFRGKLTIEECFYVLNALIQQYYSLYLQYKKVVVSDYLCMITSLGEVKVNLQIDGNQTPLNIYNEITLSFITAISQILQLVSKLAREGKWLQSHNCILFQERLTKIIYRYHQNQQRLYQQILDQIGFFMENSKIKCNLIGAVIRFYQKQKENSFLTYTQHSSETPYLVDSRSQKSCSHVGGLSCLTISQQQQKSTIHKIIDNSTKMDSQADHQNISLKKVNKSIYRHKVVRTEGEQYFSHIRRKDSQNQKEIDFSDLVVDEYSNNKEYENKHISAQYSFNILNINTKDGKEKSIKDKSNRVKFKTVTNKSSIQGSQNQSNISQLQSSHIYKNQVSLNQMTQQKGSFLKHAKSYTKSVLDDMAREVVVREEPSSKSYIF